METNNNDQVNPDIRKLYNVAVSFFVPQEGTVTIAARDEQHAREVIAELMTNQKDVNIVDVYPVDAIDMGEDFDDEDDTSEIIGYAN